MKSEETHVLPSFHESRRSPQMVIHRRFRFRGVVSTVVVFFFRLSCCCCQLVHFSTTNRRHVASRLSFPAKCARRVLSREDNFVPYNPNSGACCDFIPKSFLDIQRWAKEWMVGCVNTASWLPLAAGCEFSQPRARSFGQPCIYFADKEGVNNSPIQTLYVEALLR